MAAMRTILLAEDNPYDAELTLAAFRENNLLNPIDVVRDGALALDYLYRRDRYDGRPGADPCLILLDLKMPKVDGLEVLRTIKADERLRQIPVVALTSSRQERDLTRSYGLGVNAYVVKPVDFREFVGAVKALGGFWALVNEVAAMAERDGD
jgi:two-component system response regulator